MKKIEIRIASRGDREVLIKMFLNLLKFLDPFDHDMMPTRSNAEWITDTLFLPSAERGEPILIAWDGSKAVGALFWLIQDFPYKARWRHATEYGIYVEEAYRGQKLGTQLREKGVKILRGKGVQKLFGMVNLKNEASLKASDKFGFRPFARLDILDIEP